MASWHKYINMELSDDDKIDMICPVGRPNQADFPPGLRICLTERELEMLGLEDDCELGDCIHLFCFAEVQAVTKRDGRCSVELQITDMSAEDENDEDADDE